MLTPLSAILFAGTVSQTVFARDIPDNVRTFYDRVKNGSCTDSLGDGFFITPDSDGAWSYCQQDVAKQAIFLKTTNAFADMDVDCDGDQSHSDGRCAASTDTQSITSFQDVVASYDVPGVNDLNANIHPYVVFGNAGSYSPTFDPEAHGVRPLSVMAVVCGDKLIYGVWGDQNGDDDPVPLVGEASLSLATACFGKEMNGNNGYEGTDVLYVAFTGNEAVPGKAANWGADNFDDFEASITDLGDELIQRLGQSSPVGSCSHKDVEGRVKTG